MKNTFLSEMSSRGFLNQCTDLNKLTEITDKNQLRPILALIVPLQVFMLEVYCKL